MSKDKYIDIQVIMDPDYFPNNIGAVNLNTPLSQIPNLNGTNGVWMIAEPEHVISGQASAYSLNIKAARGDVIRWWDAPLSIDEKEKDMIIVGFYLDEGGKRKWDNTFIDTKATTKPVGVAHITSGFSLNDLKGLHFGMTAAPHNYISATVKDNATYGTKLKYLLIVAKLDVSQVGEPKLEALYSIDPHITISE